MKKIMTLLCILFAMAGNMLADSVTAGPWNLRQGEQSNVTMTLAVTDTMQTAVQFSLTLPEGVSIVKNGDGRYACELEMPQEVSYDPDALPTITIVQNEPNHYNFVIFSTENSRIPAGMSHNLVTTVQARESVSGAFTATIDNIILADVYGNKQELEPLTFDIIVEGDEEPLDQAYERAMEALVDGGTYCISSEVNGIKYYLNISGYLVDNKMEAAIFTFKKMAGEEYPYGFQIDEVYFTNPDLNGGEVVLNSGHIHQNTHARNTWEAQVFFLNANGKYAIRATNAYGGDSSWALTAKTFWTVNEGINGPVAEYTFDQPFIWQIEETVDLRPEAIRIVSSWAYKLQERQGLVNSQWISNAKEPTGGSYEALSDGDYATFFHSMWSATGPNEDHYLQAELPNAVQKFHIYFQKRQQNNVDRVTVLNISASNDGEVFHDILTLDQGLPTEPYMVNYKNVIDLGAAYKYVRFSVADVNDYLYLDTYNGHHWFTFSEFYILPDNKLTQEVLGYVINDFTEIDEEDMAYIYELDEKIAKLFESDSDIIEFVDAKVKEICVANWDTDGDGELSFDEAAAVTDLGEVFKENTEITSFEELRYFTGLTSIGEEAFYSCYNLVSVIIPNSAMTIKKGSFAFSGLTSVTIPNGVTSIEDEAFDTSPGLRSSITIPSSVISIGNNAFRCSYTTSINVETNNTKYDSRDNCNAIIETASNTLILGCGNTIIPSSVTTIRSDAFWDCYNLISITIPSSVTKIGLRAFNNCDSLSSIIVDPNNIIYDSRDNCNAIIETASNTLISGCQNTVIPQSVNTIGACAFWGCNYLTSITIPNSVTSIGANAFNSSGLTSITIPGSVISIEDAAFIGCSGLTSVTLSEGLKSIGTYAFGICHGLTSVTIPSSVTSIGDYVFAGSSGLTSIIIPNSVTSIGECAFYLCRGLTSVTIPNSVTSIGYGSFACCSGLTSIIIPNSVTSIGEYAFDECTGLTSVTIPNSVTSIKYASFANCSGLTSIIIPDGVISIGDYAFYGCSGLTSVTFPKSATSIGEGAFSDCPILSSVKVFRAEPIVLNETAFAIWDDSNEDIMYYDIYDTATLYVLAGCKQAYAEADGWYLFKNIVEMADITIPTEGLVAYYPFNGNANDESGHGNNGTPMESVTLTTGLHGDSNGAYQFGGYDNPGHIHIPNSESLQFSNAATISAYVKVSSLSGMDGWGSKVETGSMQCIWAKSHDRNGSAMFLSIRDQGLFVNVLPNTEWETFGNEAGNHELAGDYLNKWINIVCVYGDNGRNRLYINGELIAETETTPDFTKMNGQDLYLGKYSDSWYPLNGILDEVCIYNRALSFDEIQEMAKYAEAPEVDTNIAFADATVKAICVANWDTNGDGELSYDEAAAVTDLGEVFKENKEITSFEELQFFTGLTSIGRDAFSSCIGLTSITIPENVTSIGEFYVTYPETIYINAFRGCSGLTSIIVANNNSTFDSRDNCNAIIETATNTLIGGCRNTIIPSSVTSIGHWAFSGCSSLTSITIPEGVTSIGTCAFENCNVLTSITIPESVTSIGNWAFSGCSELTSITIPKGVTSISSGTFSDCSGLTSITIPEGVTSIYLKAFFECSSLTSITIPEGVTNIGIDAFNGCSSLCSITSYIEEPFAFGFSAFLYINGACVLYVPAGTRDKYLAAGWTEEVFKGGVVEMVEDYALTVSSFGEGRTMFQDAEVYNETMEFMVPADEHIELFLEPDEGYHVGTVTVNQVEYTLDEGEQILSLTMTEPMNVVVEYVANEVPIEYVKLTLTVEGMGAVMIGGVAYEDEEQTIEVAKGSNVVMQFVPETEVVQYILGKLTVNGEAVTDEVVGGVYVLHHVEEDATVSAIFVEDIDMFVVDGIKYGVPDPLEPVVKVMMYDYGEVVNVPASVVYNDKTWTVKGIGSYAFYDCSELKWLSIPATVETIERNVIKKCPRLAAITWHPAMTMPAMMATSERNPNRLYYVTDMQWAPNVGGDLNIVVGTENGTASTINLSDTEGNNDFYCPSAFTAGRISYRHYYAQHTQHRVCRGWESLVLPFDVADIRHEEKGTIAPFAALDEARIDAGEKPFWLYRYSEGGIWESADKVEANVPYIISLPNEDFYEPAYRIGGNVTFEATNVEVEATTNEVLQGVQAGSLSFRPAFQKENYVSEKYLLNVSTAYNGHPEGSLFIRYFRGAHPFEAYFTATGSSAKPYFSVFDEMVDGIESLKAMENRQSTKDNAVYDLSGRRVSASSVSSASSVLPQGVYIKNGKKFVVK